MLNQTCPRPVLLPNPQLINESLEAGSTQKDYIPIKEVPRREGPSIQYLIEHWERNNTRFL